MYFVYLAVVVCLCYFGQFTYFGLISAKMTTRVRYALLHSILKQVHACKSIVFLIVSSCIDAYLTFVPKHQTHKHNGVVFASLQEVGFFDDKDNSVGALSSKLATEAALVKAALSDSLSLLVMNVVTVVLGLGIAFYFGWELALVLLALFPLIILFGAMQLIAMAGMAGEVSWFWRSFKL